MVENLLERESLLTHLDSSYTFGVLHFVSQTYLFIQQMFVECLQHSRNLTIQPEKWVPLTMYRVYQVL